MSHSDQSQRFLFDDTDVRGEMVDLERSYSEVLAKHPYPEPVAQLLGEML
ncbi:Hsp33 family molecular chaperone HslO, partial [Klebsiella pneumoniae]